ncbi:MAG: molecular chaperone SurA [Proteobacteria bacterium]|nr:molecular chaperone SurA [Pseudomonadota bacterium]
MIMRSSILLLSTMTITVVLALLPSSVFAQDVQEELREIDRVVAVVNDDVITKGEFDSRIGALRVELETARNGDESLPMPPEELLREQLMERLVIESLQLQLGERMGLEITDEQVWAAAGQIAESNNVTVEQLEADLRSGGMSINSFIADLRRQMTIRQVVEARVTSRVRVSPDEVDELLTQLGGRDLEGEYLLRHILISFPEEATNDQLSSIDRLAEDVVRQIRSGLSFAEAAVTYSNAPDALEGGSLGWRKLGQLPSLFVEALSGMMPGQVTDVLRSQNGLHILTLEEKRGITTETITKSRARHILISAENPIAREQAKLQLESVKSRVNGGEDFAQIAEAMSDDAVSATQGGELGWLSPGETVAPFERAMNALQINELSDPVDSQFGVHLIQVLERKDEEVGDLLVRRQAAEQLRNRKSDADYAEWVREIRDEAYVEVYEP